MNGMQNVPTPAVTNADPANSRAAFITLQEMTERLPMTEQTIRKKCKKGLLPFIKLPGSRRLLFDWETVRNTLLRHQRGQGSDIGMAA